MCHLVCLNVSGELLVNCYLLIVNCYLLMVRLLSFDILLHTVYKLLRIPDNGLSDVYYILHCIASKYLRKSDKQLLPFRCLNSSVELMRSRKPHTPYLIGYILPSCVFLFPACMNLHSDYRHLHSEDRL